MNIIINKGMKTLMLLCILDVLDLRGDGAGTRISREFSCFAFFSSTFARSSSTTNFDSVSLQQDHHLSHQFFHHTYHTHQQEDHHGGYLRQLGRVLLSVRGASKESHLFTWALEMVNIVTIEKPLCVGNVEFDEDEDTGTQYHDVVYNAMVMLMVMFTSSFAL